MKRYLILACALMVLLGGCSRPEPVWETVDDEVVQPVSAAEAPMEIVFDVPEEAELLGEADCWRAYAHPDGDYAIAARGRRALQLRLVCAGDGRRAALSCGNIVRPRLLLRADLRCPRGRGHDLS